MIITLALIISCKKEYSYENGGNIPGGNPLIIGANCRIAKIDYYDSSSGVPLGSVSASINSNDTTTDITQFDSLAYTILFYTPILYTAPDTININANEYFVTDLASNGRITRLHGLSDPTDPASPQFDADYSYDATGHLVSKVFSFAGGFTYYSVNYTYTAGNLIHMTSTDLVSGTLVLDADIDYYSNIAPKNYLYIFPDEQTYAPYLQYYNFGVRPTNAIKDLKLRYYNPGNVVRDSAVSSFNTYIMSRDNYVLNVNMNGRDQVCIPARVGKLVFSYKCK